MILYTSAKYLGVTMLSILLWSLTKTINASNWFWHIWQWQLFPERKEVSFYIYSFFLKVLKLSKFPSVFPEAFDCPISYDSQAGIIP